MAQFRYVGESPNGLFEMYGHQWETGTINDVTDTFAVAKLTGNRFFEAVSSESRASTEPAKRKPGRPRKDVSEDDNALAD